MPDISEYAQFDWYQYVWYYDPTVQFPVDSRLLAQWVGVAHDVGSPMMSSEAAKTKSGHILLGQYLLNFFNYYLVFMCR
jgi:hypothetical protein